MAMRVAPGQWVRLQIPTGSQRAKIAFGGEEPQNAYIDNDRRRGGVETYAKRRCPQLRPGRHTVRVVTDDHVSEANIHVV